MELKDLDLNLLLALRQLLILRSVTGAARAVGLSQPAMSRALGRLRKALGDELLVRSGAGLELTARAVALGPRLEAVLAELEALVQPPPSFDPSTAARTFTISSADYGQAAVLPALLRATVKDAPGVALRILGGTDEHLVDALRSGEWDLALSPRRRVPDVPGIVVSALFDETFTFVTRADHPAARRPLSLERFLAIPQIALTPGGRPGNPLDELLERRGHRRRVVAHVSSFLAVPLLLADSDLGAVLPSRLVAEVQGRYRLRAYPLPVDLRGFDISQVWHERARDDPGHRWLRELMREVTRAGRPSRGP